MPDFLVKPVRLSFLDKLVESIINTNVPTFDRQRARRVPQVAELHHRAENTVKTPRAAIWGSIVTYGDHRSDMRATNVSTSCIGPICQSGRAQDRPRECRAADEVLVSLIFPMEIVAERER